MKKGEETDARKVFTVPSLTKSHQFAIVYKHARQCAFTTRRNECIDSFTGLEDQDQLNSRSLMAE